MTSIINKDQARDISQQLHSEGKSLVVTGGCFDLLHIGHITLLENAKKEGDVLIVFLESDSTIKKKGANRPIHTQKERAQLLHALKFVDLVVLLEDNMKDSDYDNLISDIRPEVIAITENDTFEERKRIQAEAVGAKLVVVNKYIPSVSTTKLLEILEKETL